MRGFRNAAKGGGDRLGIGEAKQERKQGSLGDGTGVGVWVCEWVMNERGIG